MIPTTYQRVWAFSDVHGVRSALLAALVKVGIATPDGHWCAPAGTALVGCGDYIDRGQDVAGVLHLLWTLADEAPRHGGLVVTLRGNHEQWAFETMCGDNHAAANWLANGGRATIRSLGVPDPGAFIIGQSLAASLHEASRGLRTWLAELPECAIWGDVLFVHAGPPRGRALAEYGRRDPSGERGSSVDHLWLRGDFHLAPGIAEDASYAELRSEGVSRIVFGHTAQDAATLFHDGWSLCVDTNACAAFDGPAGLTLARIPVAGPLAGADIVRIDTTVAPDRMVR